MRTVLEAIRMVLSGVARTQARCAAARISSPKMLCGSGDAKVKKLRIPQAEHVRIVETPEQPEVIAIIDALIELRCLQQIDVDRFRPVVELTEFGGEVMRGTAAWGALAAAGYLLRKLRGETRGRRAGGKGKEGLVARHRHSGSTFPLPLLPPSFPTPRFSPR